MAVVIDSLPYTLQTDCCVPWNVSQENQLSHDFPLPVQGETEQGYVIRRYLETLWLPESITPLSHLIYSLRRIQPPHSCSVTQMHPLHALLDTIILPLRAASEKYHTELPQILHDGAGAGEREESMMWFAWNYDKNGGADGETLESDEKWRKIWLERLERREVMIQILLLMLKMSLPGPSSLLPSSPRSSPDVRTSKKRKRSRQEPEPVVESLEERLESYMDKLSMCQLMTSLEPSHNNLGQFKGKAKDDRDWTQRFYENVVEPLFKASLPSCCNLLRSKLFPNSLFGEDNDVNDTPGSPDSFSSSRTLKRANSSSRGSTPLLPNSSEIPNGRERSLSRASSIGPTPAGNASKARSRSLSVSLAEDEHVQKRNVVEPRRTMTREVSMNRVFKERERQAMEILERNSQRPPVQTNNPRLSASENASKGVTLVVDTPMKRPPAASRVSSRRQEVINPPDAPLPAPVLSRASSSGVILVEDSPVKVQALSRNLSGVFAPTSTYLPVKRDEDEWGDEDDSFTSSFGSPDILLLGGGNDSPSIPPRGKAMAHGTVGVVDTPTKTRTHSR